MVAKGVTPSSKSLNDIVSAINNITIGGDIKHTLYIETFKDGYTAVGQCTAYVDGKSVWSWNTGYTTGSASGNSGNIII